MNCGDCDKPWSAQGPCRGCGWTPAPDQKSSIPIYREVQSAAPFRYPARTDRCDEPGCTLTVGEHIAEVKRLVAKIGRPRERRA